MKSRLGGSHSAKCVMHSFDFSEVEELQHQGEWEVLTKLMAPNIEEETVHNIIYQELVRGLIKKESKGKYIVLINSSINKGIGVVVLGCTELPLLIQKEDVSIEIFDTTEIHSRAAVEFALQDVF